MVSGAVILAAAALIIGGTFAFFSDSETSEGNVFVAGALDLKVDSEAHYNGLICRNIGTSVADYRWLEPLPGPATPAQQALNHYNTPCDGTWEQTDLGATNQFFDLTDVKPGDEGENTISLHVLNNDAWGRFSVNNVNDFDNDCSEPEDEVVTEGCTVTTPEGTTPDSGELAQSITFDAWLDQGAVAGFQCNNAQAVPTVGPCAADPTEGDNIQNGQLEVLFWDDESVDEASEGPFNLADVLSAGYLLGGCTVVNGNTSYDNCHGLAQDGRIVGSATYYFGLAWNVPDSVGNEAQTDSLTADLAFEVEQHRNNPNPFN